MQLDKLLKPKKICIVGANEKSGFGGDTSRNVIQYMPKENYYFVNPSRTEVFGQKCYPSIESLPENIDMVVLCTPQQTIESLLRQAALKGASGAVVYASGYKEVGTPDGLMFQQNLIESAREVGIAVMGPNCAGYVNYVDQVYPFAFVSEERNRSGAVGFVSQSGQLCLSLMDSPHMRFSYIISAGNCAVVQMEDYIDFLVDDADTKVVAIYLEGIQNPPKLVQAFKKAALKRKPIVVLKSGRSEKGRHLAASHTGSMAGSDKVFDALFAKFGVVRVNDLEELLYTSQMFAVLNKLPQKPTFASMNLSGGETGICADMGSLQDIEYPDFSEKTMCELRAMLPGYATPANPLDMTATLSYDTEKYAAALRCVMNDENIGMVIIGYTLLQEVADPSIEYMAPAIEMVMRESGAKPVAMLPFVGNTRNLKFTALLEAAGVAMLPPPEYAFKILRHLADYVKYDPTDHNLDVALPNTILKSTRIAHSEKESIALASKFGLSVPREEVAKSEDDAVRLAKGVGYPVVMKIESADILHKSDIGGVRLNVSDDLAVRETYNIILKNAKKHCPDALINGILIQEMVPTGKEIIIGVNNDPSFGPAILVGLGGVFVEVFQDTSLCLAPISRTEAYNMVNSLKGGILLRGYRGGPPLDIDSLVDAIVAVSDMAVAYKNDILEIDFNPVFVYEKGVCAVDAVVIACKHLSVGE